MSVLSEEMYFQKFQEFLLESEGDDSKILFLNTGETQTPDTPDTHLETLTQKEKKKRKRDKESSSRRKSWGATNSDPLLAQPPGAKEMKSLSKGVVEARKKKPDCKKGNKWHSSTGKFTTKSNAKSWSGGYEDSNKTDCLAGKFKTSGDGRKKITKHKCGKAPDGTKEKFKCKDSKRSWEQSVVEEDRISNLPELSASSTGDLVQELLRRINEGMDTDKILRLCSAINASAKGDYPKVSN